MAQLKKELKNWLQQTRQLPVQNPQSPQLTILEQNQPDPDLATEAVINKGHEFGETLAEDIRLIGLEGKVDTWILYSNDVIDPNHRPYVRVIKFRHADNFIPQVAPKPNKISLKPTPFEEITQKLAIEPSDALMLSVELRPGFENNQLSAKSHIIRVKSQAWGKIPDDLMQPVTKDPTILSCFDDYQTGVPITTITRVYDGSTDPKIVANIDDDLIALTPLVFGHKRLWSQSPEKTEIIKPQLPQNITPIPQKSVASGILLTRQLEKAA